jgi:hypothetical protein
LLLKLLEKMKYFSLIMCLLLMAIYLLAENVITVQAAKKTAEKSSSSLDSAAMLIRARLQDKLNNRAELLDRFTQTNKITNLHVRQHIQAEIASQLTQEELQFLIDSGIFDSIVDFAVSAYNSGTTWVQTQANAVANAFMSKVAGPVSGWSAQALSNTVAWTSNTYSKSETGLTSFANDVKNAYVSTESELEKVYTASSDLVVKAQTYLTSGGFENDLKRIGNIIKDAVKQTCDFPGAQTAMRIAVAAALKAAICAATEMQAPGCKFSVPLNVLAVKALQGQVIKCAAFTLLEQFTGLCPGRNDWLADMLALTLTGDAYDPAAYAIVGCICGGCPGTCSYSNRAVCSAKW